MFGITPRAHTRRAPTSILHTCPNFVRACHPEICLLRRAEVETGDCRDYRTWLLADRGIKEERTETSEPTQETIRKLLTAAAKSPKPHTRFTRRGNILYPE